MVDFEQEVIKSFKRWIYFNTCLSAFAIGYLWKGYYLGMFFGVIAFITNYGLIRSIESLKETADYINKNFNLSGKQNNDAHKQTKDWEKSNSPRNKTDKQ